jgi:hypothetical protein
MLAARTDERLTILESRQYFSIPVTCVKPTSPRPFDRLSRNALCNDARPILHHGRLLVLGKAAPFFLSPCGVVREKSRALKIDRGLRNLSRKVPTACPNCLRSCVYDTALSNAPWTRPTIYATIPMPMPMHCPYSPLEEVCLIAGLLQIEVSEPQETLNQSSP